MLEIIKDEIFRGDYHINESYKVLRTNVLFCGDENQVIALTSSLENEGKSTVSINLAISLAESGKKVIFIDADLRKSTILKKINIQTAVKGLSHFLSGQADLEDIVHTTNISKLDMVLAGPFPPNPSELLGGGYFQYMIEQLKSFYDYIIIDTPPIQSVIDAAVIAKICDGIIIVIQVNSISYKIAQSTKEQIERTGCKILGIVLNKADINRDKYYRKYYRYAHYQ